MNADVGELHVKLIEYLDARFDRSLELFAPGFETAELRFRCSTGL